MSESENKVFFSKINDPKTCSPLEEMSAQDVADLINKLQNENNLLKRKLDVTKKTLTFYADKNHWNESLPDIRNWYLIETTDRGNYARKVLLDIEELK